MSARETERMHEVVGFLEIICNHLPPLLALLPESVDHHTMSIYPWMARSEVVFGSRKARLGLYCGAGGMLLAELI